MLAGCTGTRHEVHESYNRNITKKGTPKDGRKIHRKARLSFRVRQKAVPLKRSYFFTSENPSSEVKKATVRDVIYELSFPSIIEWVLGAIVDRVIA